MPHIGDFTANVRLTDTTASRSTMKYLNCPIVVSEPLLVDGVLDNERVEDGVINLDHLVYLERYTVSGLPVCTRAFLTGGTVTIYARLVRVCEALALAAKDPTLVHVHVTGHEPPREESE